MRTTGSITLTVSHAVSTATTTTTHRHLTATGLVTATRLTTRGFMSHAPATVTRHSVGHCSTNDTSGATTSDVTETVAHTTHLRGVRNIGVSGLTCRR